GRHFVAFRQGGVVEHRVDEVVDRSAERQHRLTDVDQLARPLADDMDAEQLPGLAVKDQLQQPGDVAEDLAAGDLLVARLADLVGSGGFCQLLFVLADHRDFGDRVDAVGEALGRALRFEPEGVADGEPALLHRGRGECREPDHVADRVNIGQCGSIVLVDGQPPAAVGHEAGFRQVELAGGAGPADRIERLFGDDRLAALEMNPDARAVLVLNDLQFVDALAEPQGGAIFPEMVAELVDNFPVDERHQPVALVDQGHPNAEGGKDAGVFAADYAGADDGQCPRQPIEIEDVVAGEDALAVERDMRVARGLRSGGNNNLLYFDPAGAGAVDIVQGNGVGAAK